MHHGTTSFLIFLFIGSKPSPVFCGETSTAERRAYVDGSWYVVKYEYTTNGWALVPATNPPGEPHYDAVVTVYRLTKNGEEQVGKPMPGTYVPGGCFEDSPEAYIRAVTE